MTREHKLALIIGFAVVLVVGILVSDHFSAARRAEHSVAYSDTAPESIGARPLPALAAQVVDDRPDRWKPLPDAGIRDEGASPHADTEGPKTDPLGVGPVIDEPLELKMGVPVEPPVRQTPPDAGRAPGVATHTVTEQETLWDIAEHYYGRGVLWRELAAFNAGVVGADGAVREGVTLRIPSARALGVKADGALHGFVPVGPGGGGAVAPAPKEPARAATYTVRKGDYGGLIAKQTLGSSRRWNDIVAINKDVISDPDNVPVGVTLRIPSR